jgi:hypothetical protein
MNCLSCEPAEAYQNIQYIAEPISLLEDRYATTPMAVVQPAFQFQGEEELHTSFEQAISDRVMAVNRQLSRLSGPITGVRYAQPHTDDLVHTDIPTMTVSLPAVANPSHHENVWQRTVLVICLCLILVMSGFDLMGVLYLFAGR